MRLLRSAPVFALVTLVCACGGGGGGSSTPSVSTAIGTATPAPASTVTAAPTAAATLPASSSAVANAGPATLTASLPAIAPGYSATVTFPVASAGSASATLGLATTNSATVSSTARALPKSIGASNLDPLVFVTLTTSANVTFATFPTMAFSVPAGLTLPAGASLYLAYNPGDVAGGWSTLAGPATLSGTTLTFPGAAGPVTFSAGVTYAFTLLATAQALVIATPTPSPAPSVAAPSPSPTHSPSPTPSPNPSASGTAAPSASPAPTASAGVAYTCPATGTASFARAPSSGEATLRRARSAALAAAPGATFLAVTYARATAAGAAAHIADRERALGTNFVRAFDFGAKGVTIRVVTVPSASAAQSANALRAEPGVQSVSITGARRSTGRVTTPYYTNDPYFDGFAPNFEALPYAESASVPGQWDMHAIGLEHAYGYAQAGNGSGIMNASALGSAAVKIAIIDTGEDANHPELNSQLVYQHCFITSASGAQSTGSFSTDEDGHGTDVSGIAAAGPNNSIGFSGAGGKAQLYGYRVFPTPDDTCESGSPDAQCTASTLDIASAINDAVAQHVNVISMSLGGGGCSAGGVDEDTVEGTAVANAIAANVIVVAASGNGATQGVSAPGCDSGVIAVGATSLADGRTTGTTSQYTSSTAASATSSSPIEYVAHYSQYGSPGAIIHSSSAWGIVAPGGDPANDIDSDDLHWIENIWTTTPFDNNFAGSCTVDYGSTNGVGDCRTLIAGTSMATPHVAGAVALILAVAPAYQSAAAMRTLLCQTADELNDTHEGCGRLNVYHAMATALGDTVYP